MAKKRKTDAFESLLRELGAVAAGDNSGDVRRLLGRCLQDSSNRVVGAAAGLIAEQERSEFVQKLLTAYARFLDDPIETDKGCIAKQAIAEALCQLNCDDPDFFLAGMKYRQLEPAWGEPNDTAINLRGTCGFAIARSTLLSTPRKLIAIAGQMSDPSRSARMYAIQSVGDVGSDFGIPLLQMKLHAGDKHPEVMGACFWAMLQLKPELTIPIVADFLDNGSDPDLCVEAATALGTSGRDEAIQALLARLERLITQDFREAIIASLGLSRNQAAIDFLLSLIREVTHESELAIQSLAPTRFYPQIRDQVESVVRATRQPRLTAVFEEEFAD